MIKTDATLDATIARLERLRDAARHEREAHDLRGNEDAAEQSADEAFRYDEQIVALLNATA